MEAESRKHESTKARKTATKVRRALRAMAGLNDDVSVADQLDVRMEAAPRVICIRCGEHIYYLKSGKKQGLAFARTEQYEVRKDLLCPNCGAYFCAFAGKQPLIKTDRGIV